MSDTEKTPEEMGAELENPEQTEESTAENASDAFNISHCGGGEYRVLSTRNGVNAYEVKVYDLQCSCEDMQYNVPDADERNVCAHLVAALEAHPEQLEFSRQMASFAQSYVHIIADLKREIENTRDVARATQSAQEASGTGVSAEEATAKVDAANAAERLQDAFDEHIEDMRVQANAGKVWFQTGPDTPDEWPYPGVEKTFKAVTGPDCVSFVHDGSADWADSAHGWYDDKPGEWFKNALQPGDVDEYLDELGL